LLDLQNDDQHYAATMMAKTHFVLTAASSLALAFAVLVIALLTHQISAEVQTNLCKRATYLGRSPETVLEYSSANK
jgi:hypothetical protein